jgi:hypothetical protein
VLQLKNYHLYQDKLLKIKLHLSSSQKCITFKRLGKLLLHLFTLYLNSCKIKDTSFYKKHRQNLEYLKSNLFCHMNLKKDKNTKAHHFMSKKTLIFSVKMTILRKKMLAPNNNLYFHIPLIKHLKNHSLAFMSLTFNNFYLLINLLSAKKL